MFALDQGKKNKVAVVDTSDILEGIDSREVLSLTYKGDLEEHFGAEGAEYSDEDCPVETRALKATTASRYLVRDENGNWDLNPDVPFDSKHDHGVYSRNRERFPFVLRPYKYMLLRNGRDASADAILLELFEPHKWVTVPEGALNEAGDLIDRDTKDVLIHGSDTIINKDMESTEFRDDTITQWIIIYMVKKVLKQVNSPNFPLSSVMPRPS